MAIGDRVEGGPPEGPGRIVFRCHGCGVRFPDDPCGPGRCPRCGAIGGHDRLGRPRGDDPSGPTLPDREQ